MKTSIKTLIASSLTAIVLTSAVFTTGASAAEKFPSAVKANEKTNVKRVIIKGNVEVTLVQRNRDGVTYAEDNTGTVKVTQEGDILRISSTDSGLSKLIVYVNNIYRIEALENASIQTSGKLKTKFLQIFLKGNAKAEINTNSESLYTVLEDKADLKLSGSTGNHILVMGKTQKLTIDKFAAIKTSISPTEIGTNTFAVMNKK